MYWLLSPEEQDRVREKITALASDLTTQKFARKQKDQVFPFSGRKDRAITKCIIQHLVNKKGIICDPFMGSGIFAYSGLELGHKVLCNDWEPYAYRLATAPFNAPTHLQIKAAFEKITSAVERKMDELYATKCLCGEQHVLDSLFYDSEKKEYLNPEPHERMGKNRENITYRGRYKCKRCGAEEKHFDSSDALLMEMIEKTPITTFPDVELIENSRINLTAPKYTSYRALFPKRAQLALEVLYGAIQEIEDSQAAAFMLNALLCILPQSKYTDYRAKSQDLHCPPQKNRENNIWHRFCDKVREREAYIDGFTSYKTITELHELKAISSPALLLSNRDFRNFFELIPTNTCDLVITDPPYGDAVPYFEKAQLFHPFLNYSLTKDPERLAREVVITNAPSRIDKHDRDQFLKDIEKIFSCVGRVVKTHGYFVLYFRPEQNHWIRDLNTLKLYARKYGLEPLMTIDVASNDPSMRILASTAWTFSSDIVFLFLKLEDSERRWYQEDEDIDCIIYSAALQSTGKRGDPFTLQVFNENLTSLAREKGIPQILQSKYEEKIQTTLARFCSKDGARFLMTGESPYQALHHNMDPEIRVREFIPVVIEELSAKEGNFKFEQFILRLSTYLENGSRSIIQRLETSEGKLRQMLLEHAEFDAKTGLLKAKELGAYALPDGSKNILTLSPDQFEQLVGKLLTKQGFSKVNVIGQACDRGVDVMAKGPGDELYIIQCKRYRTGNNIGSSPIQRVDSYRRTRSAHHAWVVTTSDFTREGLSEGEIANVKLINGKELMQLLDVHFPGKYFIPKK